MHLKPFRKALGSSVRQKVEHAVQIQVDEDRSIFLPFAPGPVIDAQVAHGRARFVYGFLPDAAENGIVAGAHRKALENALSRTPTSYIPDEPYNFTGSFRLSGVHACNAGQPFAKDLTQARRIAAAKASDRRPQLDRHTLPWKVLQPTDVAAMTRSRALAANGTDRLLLNVYNEPE